ncbi:MAG: cupin domain-containing protein [Gammaproteobacteria bacterium]
MNTRVLVCLVLLGCGGTLSATEPASDESLPTAETLLQTTTSWDGGSISYPAGLAQVTAVRMTMTAEQIAPLHCHPVPTLGVMLAGRLQVETATGQTTVFAPGDPVVEVMNTWHRGRVVEGPVEFIVFYAGAEGINNTVLQSSGKTCEVGTP